MSDFLVKISLVPIVVAETAQPRNTDTQRELFFSKTSNFWAWADKLGGKFWGHLGYFRPIYQRLPLGRWTCEMPGSLRRCQKGRLCGPGEVGVPDRGPSSWVLENIAPPILSL